MGARGNGIALLSVIAYSLFMVSSIYVYSFVALLIHSLSSLRKRESDNQQTLEDFCIIIFKVTDECM